MIKFLIIPFCYCIMSIDQKTTAIEYGLSHGTDVLISKIMSEKVISENEVKIFLTTISNNKAFVNTINSKETEKEYLNYHSNQISNVSYFNPKQKKIAQFLVQEVNKQPFEPYVKILFLSFIESKL